MFIFNQETQNFIKVVSRLFYKIIKEETDLELKGKKILYKGYLYPINFVVFEDPKILGLYNESLYQIAINKEVLRISDIELLKNILRHELAHMYLHLTCENSYRSHGKEFKDVFRKFSWDSEFSKAQITISNESAFTKESKIGKKVKKLLDLSHSSNEHESQLAAKKAAELIEKYNLTRELNNDSLTSYAARVLCFKRKNPLYDGIYQVLSHYHVYPVYNQGRGESYLEVVGERTNVEIAHYIASFLENNVPLLWESIKKEHRLKGITAKNSFYRAFFNELSNKLKEQKIKQKKEHKEEQKKKSIQKQNTENLPMNTTDLLQKNLQRHVRNVYPRLSKTSTSVGSHCSESSKLGKKSAKDFQIRGALEKKGPNSLKKLLTW